MPSPLYSAIDETTIDRTDYIESSTAGQVYTTTLGPIAQPTANTNIDINFDANSPDSTGGIKIEVLDGASVIKTQSFSLDAASGSQTFSITPAELSPLSVGTFMPQKWRQQPQGSVQVDWSNPLTRGLVFAWEASGGARNNIDGRFATTATSGVNSGTARGLARQWDGTQASASYTWGTTYFPVAGATRVSMEAMVSISSLASERKLISKWAGIYSLLLSVSTTGKLIAAVGNGASILNAYQTNSSVISADNSLKYLVAVWRGGNNWDFYVDGVKQSGISSISSSAVASVGNASGVNFQLGRDEAGGSLIGSLVFARVRNVDLADSEVVALAQNPWQIIRPARPHLYSFPVAVTFPWSPNIRITSL